MDKTKIVNLKTGLYSSMSLTYTDNTTIEDKEVIDRLVILPTDIR